MKPSLKPETRTEKLVVAAMIMTVVFWLIFQA
jgi:predicted cobalt transporter CbtA